LGVLSKKEGGKIMDFDKYKKDLFTMVSSIQDVIEASIELEVPLGGMVETLKIAIELITELGDQANQLSSLQETLVAIEEALEKP
jgi:hypothetical protein